MEILTIDECWEILEEAAETLPEVFFSELNGGILLDEEAMYDEDFPEGEVCIMGEYLTDPYVGCSIHLYYGSFLSLAEREEWERKEWMEELRTTLVHELTHHVEFLANAHGLDDRDEEELQELMEEYRQGPLLP